MLSAIKHPAIQAAEQRNFPGGVLVTSCGSDWLPSEYPIRLCVPHTLFSYCSIQILLLRETRPVQGCTVVRQALRQSLAHIPPTLSAHRRGVLCAWQHQNKILPLPPPSRKYDCTLSKTGELSVHVCVCVSHVPLAAWHCSQRRTRVKHVTRCWLFYSNWH